MKKPLKYKHFLRQTGRADGPLTRTRWNEYRRRHALMKYVGTDPVIPIPARIYWWLRRVAWLIRLVNVRPITRGDDP